MDDLKIKYTVVGIIIVLLVVAGAVYFSNREPIKDKEPIEDEKAYTINITWDPSLIKNDRWRISLELNITNLSDEKINILWYWANITKIRFLDNTTVLEDLSGNFTEAISLNPGESNLILWSFTKYGFSEEPTDMWIDIKIKINELKETIELPFHIFVEKVTSKTFIV